MNHYTGRNALLLSLNHYEKFGPEREVFAIQAALAEVNYCQASALRSLRGGVVGEDEVLLLREATERFGIAVDGFVKCVILGAGICCTKSLSLNSKPLIPSRFYLFLTFCLVVFLSLSLTFDHFPPSIFGELSFLTPPRNIWALPSFAYTSTFAPTRIGESSSIACAVALKDMGKVQLYAAASHGVVPDQSGLQTLAKCVKCDVKCRMVCLAGISLHPAALSSSLIGHVAGKFLMRRLTQVLTGAWNTRIEIL